MKFIVDGGTRCRINPGDEVNIVSSSVEKLTIASKDVRILVRSPVVKFDNSMIEISGFYQDVTDCSVAEKYETFFMLFKLI